MASKKTRSGDSPPTGGAAARQGVGQAGGKASCHELLRRLPFEARRAYLLLKKSRHKQPPIQPVLPELLLLVDEDEEHGREAAVQIEELRELRNVLKRGDLGGAERIVTKLGLARGAREIMVMREARVASIGKDVAERLWSMEKERRARQNPRKNKALVNRTEGAERARRKQQEELLRLARQAHAEIVGAAGNVRRRLPRVGDVWATVAKKSGLSERRVSRVIKKRFLEEQGLKFRKQ